jgi:hypothetical protein
MLRLDFARKARLGVRRLDAAFKRLIKDDGLRLFCFLGRRDNGVEVRPIAGFEFGME